MKRTPPERGHASSTRALRNLVQVSRVVGASRVFYSQNFIVVDRRRSFTSTASCRRRGVTRGHHQLDLHGVRRSTLSADAALSLSACIKPLHKVQDVRERRDQNGFYDPCPMSHRYVIN